MNSLPIETIVTLKKREINRKAMIISRLPLMQRGDEVGYFDYGACVYPDGKATQQDYFFNQEDIDEVIFKGYTDDEDSRYQEQLNKGLENVQYPHFHLD